MEHTRTAAEVILAVVPIVGIVIGGIVVFFYLLWRHREITLQIKTGAYKSNKIDIQMFSFFTGILLTGIGIVLSFFFILIGGLSYQLLGGLIPLALGICLLIIYAKFPKKPDSDGTK